MCVGAPVRACHRTAWPSVAIRCMYGKEVCARNHCDRVLDSRFSCSFFLPITIAFEAPRGSCGIFVDPVFPSHPPGGILHCQGSCRTVSCRFSRPTPPSSGSSFNRSKEVWQPSRFFFLPGCHRDSVPIFLRCFVVSVPKCIFPPLHPLVTFVVFSKSISICASVCTLRFVVVAAVCVCVPVCDWKKANPSPRSV